MNCEEARAAVSRSLDGEPDSLAALRHGMLCASCSAWAREVHVMDDGLHELLGEVEEAPEGFAERLFARLPEESPLELASRREARGAGDTAGWMVTVAALVAAFEWGGTTGGIAGVREALPGLVAEAGRGLAEIAAGVSAGADALALPAGALDGLPMDPWALGGGLVVAIGLQWGAARGLRREEVRDA